MKKVVVGDYSSGNLAPFPRRSSGRGSDLASVASSSARPLSGGAPGSTLRAAGPEALWQTAAIICLASGLPWTWCARTPRVNKHLLFAVCIGLQMLFGESREGDAEGFRFLPSRVIQFPTQMPYTHLLAAG